MDDGIENPIVLDCDNLIKEIGTNTMNDREVLDRTRSFKFAMLGHLVDPNNMPNDPKDINAVMNIIDSLDRVALTNIRMNQEAQDGAAAQEAIRILNELSGVLGNTNPYRSETRVVREVTIEETLAHTPFVPGEASTEIRDIEYDSFVSKFVKNDE